MKRGILALIILSVALGCSKENKENETGMLSFRLAEQRIEVASINTTKVISGEVLDAFTITVPNTDIAGVSYGSIKGTNCILQVGNYTAFAESCTAAFSESAENNFGCIRYAGSQDFEISAYDKATVTIPCSVANSKISILLNSAFLSIFDPAVTTITISKNPDGTGRALLFSNFTILSDSGTSAVAMTDDSKSATRYAFYPAGSHLYIQVTTRKTGGTETITYRLVTQIATQAAAWHKISIGADLNSTSGGIDVTVGSSTPEPVNNGFSIDGYSNGNVTED